MHQAFAAIGHKNKQQQKKSTLLLSFLLWRSFYPNSVSAR